MSSHASRTARSEPLTPSARPCRGSLPAGLALLLALAALLAVVPAAGAASDLPERASYRAAGIELETRTVRYGPFTVAPSMGDHHAGSGNVFRADVRKPCRRCGLVAAVPDLVHLDGSSANYDTGAMLHHLVLFNAQRRDATCRGWAERFFAAGNERTPFLLPPGYGYAVKRKHRWNLLTHLMNMGQHDKRLRIDIDFYYARPAADLSRVRPVWLDIANCTNSEYSIPAGRSVERASFRVTRPLEGRLLTMAGHLHDDGMRIRTVRRRNGHTRNVCTSRAGYGTDPSYKGHIESMSGCFGDPLARLKRGDRLNLRSIYRSAVPRHDVMGIMLGYLKPRAWR